RCGATLLGDAEGPGADGDALVPDLQGGPFGDVDLVARLTGQGHRLLVDHRRGLAQGLSVTPGVHGVKALFPVLRRGLGMMVLEEHGLDGAGPYVGDVEEAGA